MWIKILVGIPIQLHWNWSQKLISNDSGVYYYHPSLRAKSSALRCVYLFNIFRSLCPVMADTSMMFNPFSKNLDVASCLRSWSLRFFIPAFLIVLLHWPLKAISDIGKTFPERCVGIYSGLPWPLLIGVQFLVTHF